MREVSSHSDAVEMRAFATLHDHGEMAALHGVMSLSSDVRFTFTLTGGLALDVVSFQLEEGLSEPFVLTLELSSADPAIDFGQVLDRPALFMVWHGETPVRHVHGLVSTFAQGDSGFRRTRYRAVLEPALARLGLCSGWRIFQRQSVPDIAQSVFKRTGILDVDTILNREHLAREYCVQPGETDLAFIERLCAEECIYYAFTHSAQEHRLVFGDRLYAQGTIGGHAVIYNAMPGGDAAEPCLRTFRYTEQVRSAIQTQKDYSFRHPRYAQLHTQVATNLGHQRKDYERYDYAGRYKQDAAGKPFTENRLLGLRRDAQIAFVEGDDARLQPGLAFKLVGHVRDDWNTGWRVVRMVHEGHQPTSQEEDSADATTGTPYSHRAEIVPDRMFARPA